MLRHQLFGVAIGVLSSAAAAAADRSRSPSHLDASAIVVDVALGPTCADSKALAIAQRESSQIWAKGGVNLRWMPAADLPYAGPPSNWLVVQCEPAAAARSAPTQPQRAMPIATIRFIDSRPTNTITLSVENAMALLIRDDGAASSRAPSVAVLHDLRLGRMLGRAIAHEVGHFLSESGEHTPRGLMRATHSVAALTGSSLGPFAVDERHARRLQARRAADDAETYEF